MASGYPPHNGWPPHLTMYPLIEERGRLGSTSTIAELQARIAYLDAEVRHARFEVGKANAANDYLLEVLADKRLQEVEKDNPAKSTPGCEGCMISEKNGSSLYKRLLSARIQYCKLKVKYERLRVRRIVRKRVPGSDMTGLVIVVTNAVLQKLNTSIITQHHPEHGATTEIETNSTMPQVKGVLAKSVNEDLLRFDDGHDRHPKPEEHIFHFPKLGDSFRLPPPIHPRLFTSVEVGPKHIFDFSSPLPPKLEQNLMPDVHSADQSQRGIDLSTVTDAKVSHTQEGLAKEPSSVVGTQLSTGFQTVELPKVCQNVENESVATLACKEVSRGQSPSTNSAAPEQASTEGDASSYLGKATTATSAGLSMLDSMHAKASLSAPIAPRDFRETTHRKRSFSPHYQQYRHEVNIPLRRRVVSYEDLDYGDAPSVPAAHQEKAALLENEEPKFLVLREKTLDVVAEVSSLALKH